MAALSSTLRYVRPLTPELRQVVKVAATLECGPPTITSDCPHCTYAYRRAGALDHIFVCDRGGKLVFVCTDRDEKDEIHGGAPLADVLRHPNDGYPMSIRAARVLLDLGVIA